MQCFVYSKGDNTKRKRKSLQLPRHPTGHSNKITRKENISSSSTGQQTPTEAAIFKLELDEDSTEGLFTSDSSLSDISSTSSELPSFSLQNLFARKQHAQTHDNTEKQKPKKKRGRHRAKKRDLRMRDEVVLLSSSDDDSTVKNARRSMPPLVKSREKGQKPPQTAANSVRIEETLQGQVGSSDTTPIVSPSNCITPSCSTGDSQGTLDKLDRLKLLISTTEHSDGENRDLTTSGSSLLPPPLLATGDDTEQTATTDDAQDDIFFPSQFIDDFVFNDVSSQPNQENTTSDSEGENAVALIAKQGQPEDDSCVDICSSEQGSDNMLEKSSNSFFQIPSLVSFGHELSTQPHYKLKSMSVIVEKLNSSTIITCTQPSTESEDEVTSLPVSIKFSKLLRIPCSVSSRVQHTQHSTVFTAANIHKPPEQSSSASKHMTAQVRPTDPRSRNKGVFQSANFSHSRHPPLLGVDTHRPVSIRKDSCNDVLAAQLSSCSKPTKIGSKSIPTDSDKTTISTTPTKTLPSNSNYCYKNTTVVNTPVVNTGPGPAMNTRPMNTRPVNIRPVNIRPGPAVNTRPSKVMKVYSLYGSFLSWNPAWFLYPDHDADGKIIRPWFNCRLPDALPHVFSEYDHYFSTFISLLLTELWDCVSSYSMYTGAYKYSTFVCHCCTSKT